MNRQLFSLAAISLLCATASAQGGVWSQSTDNTTITSGSASCSNTPGGITENSYWRKYDPIACGLTTDYEIQSVTFGVEDASTGTSGMQLLTVNIRAANAAWPAGGTADTILGSGTVIVADTDVTQQTFETVSFNPPVFVTAGTCIAVEVMAPLGQPQDDFFFIGSNSLGETPLDSTYVSAAACGITDPTPYSVIGFPDVHGIIDLDCNPAGPTPIGTAYCPNNANSTGLPATLSATGSTAAAAMDVLLAATDLPPSQFGFFIASRTQGFVANPGGSDGNICVLGNQGRYNDVSQGQILNSGATGDVSLQVGAINVPTNPGPGETIGAGDTWNWQLWYRDSGTNSNFSNALEITFL